MSSRSQIEFDAAVRIEVLRARATLERLNLSDHVEQLAEEANPLNLLLGVVGGRKRGWMRHGLDFLGKYPMILATVATLLSGSSSGAARAGGAALAAAQSLIEKQGSRPSSSL